MKKIPLCIFGLFLCSGIYSQDSPATNYWTGGTAYNVPRHRWELGLFTVSRYGISKNLEISAHPIMVFLMPQVNVKIGWARFAGFRVATEHGIFYPTQFMRMVAARGAGGLISPEFKIPQMIAISDRILVSCSPFKKAVATVHGGITFSVKSASPDRRTTIDLPVIYPRFAVFYDQPEFDAGLDFRGHFFPRFGWLINVENFFICAKEQNYFLENKGVLVYTSKKENLRVEAGGKLCFGRYPAGPQWHLLPLIDLVFGIGR
ncbi:MAG: hypothetical protein WCK34_05850 [Bacteroidota bacterium]